MLKVGCWSGSGGSVGVEGLFERNCEYVRRPQSAATQSRPFDDIEEVS